MINKKPHTNPRYAIDEFESSCEENEKDRHESAVTLQLRIDDKVDRQDLNTTVASILDSAGIDISSKAAKSFTVGPSPPPRVAR